MNVKSRILDVLVRNFSCKKLYVQERNKNWYKFSKINKYIWNENENRLPDYLLNNIFFENLLITF